MREWGVEAITYLVKAALQHKYQPPLRDNQVSCILFLSFLLYPPPYKNFDALGFACINCLTSFNSPIK